MVSLEIKLVNGRQKQIRGGIRPGCLVRVAIVCFFGGPRMRDDALYFVWTALPASSVRRWNETSVVNGDPNWILEVSG